MTVWEWVVPLPPAGLGQNARGHWGRRHRATAAYRAEVVAAIASSRSCPPAPLSRARLTLVGRIARTRPSAADASALRFHGRYRPRDVDNLDAACKALVDALGCRGNYTNAAGVIADDAARHLERGATQITYVQDWRDEGVVVRLEAIE